MPPLSVVAEGVVRPEEGPGPRAVDRALREAVAVVVRRYVPPSDLETHRDWLRRRVYGRAGTYVLRYTIRTEDRGFDGARVEISAEVDRGRLLAALAARGLEVRRLASWPRLLLAPVAGADAPALVDRVASILGDLGVTVRRLPSAAAEGGRAADLAEAARDLGCHLVVAVLVDGQVGVPEPEDLFSVEAVRPEADFSVDGWVLDARDARAVDLVEGAGRASGATPVDARQAAVERAARSFAYRLTASVEQSGWSPGEVPVAVDVWVRELPDPRSVEEVGRALAGLTEVQAAVLREVGFHAARWRLQASVGESGWAAVLGSATPVRGRIEWVAGPGAPASGGAPDRVEARWAP